MGRKSELCLRNLNLQSTQIKPFRDIGNWQASSSFNFELFLETPFAVEEMAWGQVIALYR